MLKCTSVVTTTIASRGHLPQGRFCVWTVRPTEGHPHVRAGIGVKGASIPSMGT